MNRAILIQVMTILSLPIFAQSKLTGTVVDGATGETLIGASIVVQGTGTGGVTDLDGHFSIDLPKGKTKVKTDYYKQYSNLAKREIVNAIGDNDDAIHFLFDNNDAVGRRPLRSMNLDVNEISLPQDLLQLANDMPDGRKILYDYENDGHMYE